MPRVAVARPSRVHTLRSTFSFVRFFPSSLLCSPRATSLRVTWPHTDMVHWLLRRWCRRRSRRCVSHFCACDVFALRAPHLTFSHCTSNPTCCNIRNCRCAAVSERHCNQHKSSLCSGCLHATMPYILNGEVLADDDPRAVAARQRKASGSSPSSSSSTSGGGAARQGGLGSIRNVSEHAAALPHCLCHGACVCVRGGCEVRACVPHSKCQTPSRWLQLQRALAAFCLRTRACCRSLAIQCSLASGGRDLHTVQARDVRSVRTP
jgi:hypothetical protein